MACHGTTCRSWLATGRVSFDWRVHEARLNALPQSITDIQGQPIHFIHARSPEPNALPLILTHGWPSTPFEFAPVIGALTDPRRHGGDPADAFHIVAPALPGYGFSTPLTQSGWGNLFRVAMAWLELMDRLGYQRFAAHGTDVGSGVTGLLSMLAPDRVLGTHVTGTTAAMPFGPPLELDRLPQADRERAARFNEFREQGIGYLHMQATRPQTLGYSLNDSPLGLLAWIVEKFHEWTDPAVELPEDAVGRDELLTNVSLFWFTGSGASSAHAIYDGMQAWRESAAQQPHDAPDLPPSGFPARHRRIRSGHNDPKRPGPTRHDGALDGVRLRRALPRPGDTRAAHRRPARVLPDPRPRARRQQDSPASMTTIDLVRSAYDAFAHGDVPRLLSKLDPNIEWCLAESHPYCPDGTPLRGHDQLVERFLAPASRDWQDFKVHQVTLHDAGDVIAAEIRYTGTFKATGATLDAQGCHIWTVRSGKITRFHQYVDTARLQRVTQPP